MGSTDRNVSEDSGLKTHQEVLFGDARSISSIDVDSIDLVVTSPPYPMIEMWDSPFSAMNQEVGKELAAGRGKIAFELMHLELDKVWRECFRLLRPGAIACINIGDAVRTVNGDFQMYPNHGRIVSGMAAVGFTPLPDIIWRKPTNSPTKFMGSGMLPAGAYVTYEHEYILVFKKGLKRTFKNAAEKENRHMSAFFWEERNRWFSDVWADLVGSTQGLDEEETRSRSAAFPFELAFRLISMYSTYGDTVLDPFLGTGTTLAGALAAGRNGIGVEIDHGFSAIIERTIQDALPMGEQRVRSRLSEHVEFVRTRQEAGSVISHWNGYYGFPVISGQEKEIRLFRPSRLSKIGSGQFEIDYEEARMKDETQPISFSPSRGSKMDNGTLW